MLSAVHLAILVELGTYATWYDNMLFENCSLDPIQTNAFIQDLAEKAGTLIWLGLRCPDAIAKNCRWDDDQGAPNQYDAFYPDKIDLPNHFAGDQFSLES
ncbi:unnamed protein product [Cylicocyclus nassatus]|uniref:Alpha-galactosidase n=1 Tax=Cylicocyclus nassatus TaxID=53992 RepID=A0AA36GKC4_CYLNA|nr:unnamed protein product [Cylicocyclus nassatus]